MHPGAIPPELGRLTNLTQLILSGNALSGTFADSLPICVCPVQHKNSRAHASIGNLTNLKYLELNNNQLSGACVEPVQHTSSPSDRNAPCPFLAPSLSVTEQELKELLPNCGEIRVEG